MAKHNCLIVCNNKHIPFTAHGRRAVRDTAANLLGIARATHAAFAKHGVTSIIFKGKKMFGGTNSDKGTGRRQHIKHQPRFSMPAAA